MPLVEGTDDELRDSLPSTEAPNDLRAFWCNALADLPRPRILVRETWRHLSLPGLHVEHLSYTGFADEPIHCWFIQPNTCADATVVKFLGYGVGRSTPLPHLIQPVAGYSTLVVETRGQGGGPDVDTADSWPTTGAAVPGYLTRGISEPHHYYYFRAYLDAALAVQLVAAELGSRSDSIVTIGHSQGAALALAAAALQPELVAQCYADTPFLCDIAHSAAVAADQPYAELSAFLGKHPDRADQALNTLSYFDLAHLSASVLAHTSISLGLMDACCPPRGIYATYNQIPGRKRLRVRPFGDHSVPDSDVLEATMDLQRAF